MFKKLRDKIAEEVRQAPLRLPSTVQQQLNQTLVDIAEETGDGIQNQFSITSEGNSPVTSPTKTAASHIAEFFQVDLQEPKAEDGGTLAHVASHAPSTGRLSRQSSLNSVFSDVSFLPGSESYHPYQFQSDLESNVSEFEESASGHHVGERISKEQIYNAFHKMRTRYHKYKGRYVDLARHYKELEREKEKVKNVLAETQDRALRRISELKEQCSLEQQAKAHLEENLRSDLEEKDNIISVLQTKVKLLTSTNSLNVSGGSGNGTITEGTVVDAGNHNASTNSEDNGINKEQHGDTEINALKEKLKRFESLLNKCKENIKSQKEKIAELQNENSAMKQTVSGKDEEIQQLKNSHTEQLASLTESLDMARQEIKILRNQEQEAALAAAETKQKVHEELLKQEEETQRLRFEREQLQNKVIAIEKELESAKHEMENRVLEAETLLEAEKQKLLKELSRGKTESLKLMEEDMEKRLEQLAKDKNAEWEITLQRRLTEAEEAHQRLLRTTEDQNRKLFAELQEEKSLALEEKELHYTSILSRERNAQLELQEKIAALNGRIEEMDKEVEKVKEELLSERRSWVQQIEGNRQRHLEEIRTLNEHHQKQLEAKITEHQNALDTIVLELREKHRKELDDTQRQHEELLQAANEDLESSARTQLDQLRNLLREKEAELGKQSRTLDELTIELKNKNKEINELGSTLKHLNDRITAIPLLEKQLAEMKSSSDMVTEELRIEKAQSQLLKENVASIQNIIAEKEQSINSLDIKLKDNEAALVAAEKELSAVKSRESLLQKELESIATEHTALKNEFNEMTNDNRTLQNNIVGLEDQLQNALQAKNDVEAQLTKAEKLNSSLREKVKKLKATEKLLNEKDSELSLLKEKLIKSTNLSDSKIAELSALIEESRKEFSKSQEELQFALNQIANISQTKEQLSSNMIQLDGEISDLKKLLIQKEETICNMDVTFKSQLLEKDTNIAQSLGEIERLSKLVEDLNVKIKTHEEECEILSGELKIMKENALKNAALEENLQQKLKEKEQELDSVLEEQENLRRSLILSQNQETSIQSLSEELGLLKEEKKRQEINFNEVNNRVIELVNEQEILQNEKLTASNTIKELERVLHEAEAKLEAAYTNLDTLQETQTETANKIRVKEEQIESSNQMINQQKENILALESQLTDLQKEKQVLIENQNRFKNELDANVQMKMELQQHLIEIEKEKKETEYKFVCEMDSANSLKEKILLDLHEVKNERDSLVGDRENLSQQLSEISKVKNDLQQKNQQLLEQLEHSIEKVKTLEEQFNQKDADRQLREENYKQEYQMLEAELSAVKQKEVEEKLVLEHKLETCRNDKVALEDTIRLIKESLLAEQKKVQIEKQAVQNLEAKLLDQKIVMDELRANFNHLEVQHSELSQTNQSLKEDLTRMREENDCNLLINQTEAERLSAKCLEMEQVIKTLQETNQQASEAIITNEKLQESLKELSEELNTTSEEKNRLDTLCKRLKVQLADVRKAQTEQKECIENEWKERLQSVELALSQAKEELRETITKQELVKNDWSKEQENIQKANQISFPTVQSTGQSHEVLQQQLFMVQQELDATRQRHKMEVADLRRLVEMGKSPVISAANFHNSLEEATELEYLRNILFEYMMGRQPTTLVKVLAAVVKFTPEQTRKVLEHEEHRQSLLGHLGFV